MDQFAAWDEGFAIGEQIMGEIDAMIRRRHRPWSWLPWWRLDVRERFAFKDYFDRRFAELSVLEA